MGLSVEFELFEPSAYCAHDTQYYVVQEEGLSPAVLAAIIVRFIVIIFPPNFYHGDVQGFRFFSHEQFFTCMGTEKNDFLNKNFSSPRPWPLPVRSLYFPMTSDN